MFELYKSDPKTVINPQHIKTNMECTHDLLTPTVCILNFQGKWLGFVGIFYPVANQTGKGGGRGQDPLKMVLIPP